MRKNLKLFSATVSTLLFLSTAADTSAQSFRESNLLISASYGFGNDGSSFFSALRDENNYHLSLLGPIFFKAEIGVSDKVGLGIAIDYLNSTASFNYQALDNQAEEHTYTATISTNTYNILGRVNFHFLNDENIDPYWGIGVGYRNRWTNISDDQPEGDYGFKVTNTLTNMGFETTLGIRYYPMPKLGILAEIGIAKAPVQIGLTYRFGSEEK